MHIQKMSPGEFDLEFNACSFRGTVRNLSPESVGVIMGKQCFTGGQGKVGGTTVTEVHESGVTIKEEKGPGTSVVRLGMGIIR